jgi:hypothetical protein
MCHWYISFSVLEVPRRNEVARDPKRRIFKLTRLSSPRR